MHIRKHFLEKTIDAETRQMEANKMLLKCARKIRCDKMFQNVFFLQTRVQAAFATMDSICLSVLTRHIELLTPGAIDHLPPRW